jgi:carbon-monoxide dehydrogenase medium subunit
MKAKEYFRPSSIEEAVRVMRRSAAQGAYLAGGTDLVPSERSLSLVIDLTALGLDYIKPNAHEIRIGATTTINELACSPDVPNMLREAASNFASVQLRNVATIGGNLASAVPSADMALPLLALDAQVRIRGQDARVVSVKEFFIGPRQTLLKDDLLVEMIVPRPSSSAHEKFFKLSHRPGDIAIVSSAVLLEERNKQCQKVRIALGAVAPIPMRAAQAEAFLEGKALTEENIRKVAELVASEVRPITDHRASADYRRKMSALLTRRIFTGFLREDGDEAPAVD